MTTETQVEFISQERFDRREFRYRLLGKLQRKMLNTPELVTFLDIIVVARLASIELEKT